MWEKMLFSRGTLGFQFEPDQRISGGFCPYWSMIHMNVCIFEFFSKMEISSHMAVEYAPQPKKGQKIFLGENGFCSKSAAHNAEKLDFFAFFESFHFQLHHTAKWAKSDRNSLIWFKLKSERWFWFFIFFKMKKNLGDMRMDLAGTSKMSRKNLFFFRAQIHFLKLPKLIFYRFWAKISATENSMTFSAQKQQKLTLESSFEFPLSNFTHIIKKTTPSK